MYLVRLSDGGRLTIRLISFTTRFQLLPGNACHQIREFHICGGAVVTPGGRDRKRTISFHNAAVVLHRLQGEVRIDCPMISASVWDTSHPVSRKSSFPVQKHVLGKGGSNPRVASPHAPSPGADSRFLPETSAHILQSIRAEYTQYLSLSPLPWPPFTI